MSVKNYTNVGFKKIRAPDDLFLALKEFWEANHHMEQIEWHSINTYHNMWESPPTIIYVEDATLIGGGEPFKQTISDAVQTILEEWSGQRLSPVSLYGIRIYKNNSILVRTWHVFSTSNHVVAIVFLTIRYAIGTSRGSFSVDNVGNHKCRSKCR